MKIVVSPNPYRDKQFKNARQACSILREAGAEVALCLPFDVDKNFEIPSDLRFRDIQMSHMHRAVQWIAVWQEQRK